jgi:inner membrane protein involved in colicin E2 resistance
MQTLNVGAGRTDNEYKADEQQRRADLLADSRMDANYFFLAAAFFSFHLLLAYLVDHLQIHASFLISSAVSLFLVVTYLRRAAGLRSAIVREAALAQLVYLVLFSYAFFFEGYTGLTVTIGAVLTLFVLMQITARVDWGEVFARPGGAASSAAPR